MTTPFRILLALFAAWLLAAAASLAAAPPVTEEMLAPLTAAYMRAVKPGEQADLHRALFRTVLARTQRSYPRDIDMPALIAEALKPIEPLAPHSSEPAEVFGKSINAALSWLDPHSYYLDPSAQRRERSIIEGASATEGTPALRWSMEGGVLVLRLANFMGRMSADVEKAVADATAAGAPRGVVLDLRGNLGGVIGEGVRTADAFLAKGEIVSMRGRDSVIWRAWQANATELLPNVPMVVLIDGGSASVSELVAAALQENGRATVMGQRSFGKGSIQEFVPLEAGQGALYVTIGLFHGPSGRSVQLAGVGPDIELVASPRNTAWEWRREAERENALPGTGEPLPPKARVEESRCAAGRTKIDAALDCALAFLEAGGIEAFLRTLDTGAQKSAHTRR